MKTTEEVIRDAQAMARAGFAEYSLGGGIFGNFERIANELSLTREKVLLVFLAKHLDGIRSWKLGHKSQREPVYGRFLDAIVYVAIFMLMRIKEETEEACDLERLCGTIELVGMQSRRSMLDVFCSSSVSNLLQALPIERLEWLWSLIQTAREVE